MLRKNKLMGEQNYSAWKSICQIITDFNKNLRRKIALRKLKNYYRKTQADAHKVMDEFARIRRSID